MCQPSQDLSTMIMQMWIYLILLTGVLAIWGGIEIVALVSRRRAHAQGKDTRRPEEKDSPKLGPVPADMHPVARAQIKAIMIELWRDDDRNDEEGVVCR